MRGLLRIAYKLLTNERGKFIALLMGIAFAVFLMVMMRAVFSGILRQSAATVTNTGAKMWVMDPAVNNVLTSIPVPDYVLDAVRSTPGVRSAVPLYSGAGLVRLSDGTYQPATLIGLDDTTLLGRPKLVEGHIEDLFADDAVIVVRDGEYPKLNSPGIGTTFELNDRRAVVVGIAETPASGLFGLPTLYTTFNRATSYIPSPRFTISYVLVEPTGPAAVPGIQRAIADLGYLALTEKQFSDRIADFYKYKTGVGTNILIMMVISFVVGLSISAQTFYTFVLEHLERFGALKAIGAHSRDLVFMIVFQVGVSSFAGYGLGVGLCSLLIMIAKARLPSYVSIITFGNLLFALAATIVIAVVSSYLGIRRVLRIEPFEIFRA
ncbi:MAG: ABC transporter permease [Deltaproteobacteria bacterium]|nr:ABC transporter permease [Deltaproteobacteria bacterium]